MSCSSVPLLIGGDPGIRADDPEPSVYELLNDPVMKLVMKRDGIHRTELLFLVEVARMRLRARPMRDQGGRLPASGVNCYA